MHNLLFYLQIGKSKIVKGKLDNTYIILNENQKRKRETYLFSKMKGHYLFGTRKLRRSNFAGISKMDIINLHKPLYPNIRKTV